MNGTCINPQLVLELQQDGCKHYGDVDGMYEDDGDAAVDDGD